MSVLTTAQACGTCLREVRAEITPTDSRLPRYRILLTITVGEGNVSDWPAMTYQIGPGFGPHSALGWYRLGVRRAIRKGDKEVRRHLAACERRHRRNVMVAESVDK